MIRKKEVNLSVVRSQVSKSKIKSSKNKNIGGLVK